MVPKINTRTHTTKGNEGGLEIRPELVVGPCRLVFHRVCAAQCGRMAIGEVWRGIEGFSLYQGLIPTPKLQYKQPLIIQNQKLLHSGVVTAFVNFGTAFLPSTTCTLTICFYGHAIFWAIPTHRGVTI